MMNIVIQETANSIKKGKKISLKLLPLILLLIISLSVRAQGSSDTISILTVNINGFGKANQVVSCDSGKLKFFDINDSFLVYMDNDKNCCFINLFSNQKETYELKESRITNLMNKEAFVALRGNTRHIGNIRREYEFCELHINREANIHYGTFAGRVEDMIYLDRWWNSILVNLSFYKNTEDEYYQVRVSPFYPFENKRQLDNGKRSVTKAPHTIHQSKRIHNIKQGEKQSIIGFISEGAFCFSDLNIIDSISFVHLDNAVENFFFVGTDSVLLMDSTNNMHLLNLRSYQSTETFVDPDLLSGEISDIKNFNSNVFIIANGDLYYFRFDENKLKLIDKLSFGRTISTTKISKDGSRLAVF